MLSNFRKYLQASGMIHDMFNPIHERDSSKVLVPQVVKEIKIYGTLPLYIGYAHGMLAEGVGDLYDWKNGICRMLVMPSDVAAEPGLRDVKTITLEYEVRK